VVDYTQDFTDRDLRRVAGEAISAVDTATTGDNGCAAKFKENLLQIFDGNAIVGGDFMNGDNSGMLHREVQNRAGRVLGFGGNSHTFRRVDFHTGTPVSMRQVETLLRKSKVVWAKKIGDSVSKSGET